MSRLTVGSGGWRLRAIALVLAAVAGESLAASPAIVISQVYGGGGNTGATLTNDFVGLFNRSNAPVAVDGWTVQYASAAGSTWQTTALSGTIASGQYYLVREARGAGGTIELPVADAAGNIAMSASSGKVALVAAATPLSESCPAAAAYVDLVGYGGSATCYEGSEEAPTLGNTTAAARRGGGCLDSDDNAADFVETSPDPRNSATPVHPCSAESETPIHTIQGTGPASPLVGQVVKAPGIVTAVRSDGFFMQCEDAFADGDPATSEGIFVYTGAPVSPPVVGDEVRVTGTAAEYTPCESPAGPSLTEINDVIGIQTVSTGNAVPAATEITAADAPAGAGLDVLERFEGMRVRLASLTVVAATATQQSRSVFYGVTGALPRPFREAGIEAPWPIPTPPCCIPRFDGNGERLRIESDQAIGAPVIDVAAGATVTDLAGTLTFHDCTQTILPDPAVPPAVSDPVAAAPAPLAAAGEIAIASANLHNLFDDVDDPATDDDVPTAQALETHLAKTSLAVRTLLGTPDIIGVVEVENLAVLELLAQRIDADGLASGAPAVGFQAYLVEGNDGRGIDVGFLVRPDRVAVVDTFQVGKGATHTHPLNGLPVTTFDRPPLVLRAVASAASGAALPITVVVNHLKSLIDIEQAVDGAPVRAKRRAQAEYLAAFIQQRQAADPGEHIAVIGDFNAFEVNDGYADVMGTIRGEPAHPDTVELPSPDLVDPDLVDLVERLPQAQRYSYVYRGNAQALDHVLVTRNLLRHLRLFGFARCNADFPTSLSADGGRPERHSDHDAAVAVFAIREPGTVRRRLKAVP